MVIRPILLYAAPVWSSTCKSNINILEIIQNIILRTISNCNHRTKNKDIRKELKIDTIRDIIYKLTKNFFANQINHLPILKNLGKYNKHNAPFKLKHLNYHITY